MLWLNFQVGRLETLTLQARSVHDSLKYAYTTNNFFTQIKNFWSGKWSILTTFEPNFEIVDRQNEMFIGRAQRLITWSWGIQIETNYSWRLNYCLQTKLTKKCKKWLDVVVIFDVVYHIRIFREIMQRRLRCNTLNQT